MTDHELDQLLERTRWSEPPPEFWEQLPRRVIAGVRTAALVAPVRGTGSVRWHWGLGLATACLAFALAIGFHKGNKSQRHTDPLARAQTVFREVSALFPNRIRAIVMDEAALRLVLSDAADVPATTPVWVEICKDGHCRNVITFSGQQVRLNGESIEVLSDARGNILVVGPRWVWSSAPSMSAAGSVQIQARALGGFL